MSTDAQDWQRVVKTVGAAGAVPDAPDWQRIVVGPGGAPVGGGGGGGDPYMPSSRWGWAAQTMPWWMMAAQLGCACSAIYWSPIAITADVTVSNTWVYNSTNFTPNTADNNYMGIYQATTPGSSSTSYELIASSAPGVCDALFANTGYLEVPMQASVKLAASSQTYFVAILYNSPHFAYGSPYDYIPNLAEPTGEQDTYRSMLGNGNLLTTITPADIVTSYAPIPWFAVS